MLILICDRCESSENAEIYGYTNPNPFANAFSNSVLADVKMPVGWAKVLGKHLCGECIKKVEVILEPLAREMTR